MQVPHGALRLNVMGERGANHEDATPDDIAAMAELARQGIEAGALGFTTSRTRNHKTSTGAYTPTLTAAPDELIGIAQAVGATGTGVLQVVSDFLDLDDEFAMLREMVATSGARCRSRSPATRWCPTRSAACSTTSPPPTPTGSDDRPGRAAGGGADPRVRVHAQPVPHQPGVPRDRRPSARRTRRCTARPGVPRTTAGRGRPALARQARRQPDRPLRPAVRDG
jgi:hypothetical protein